jgi:hypothetical protein
MRKNRLFDHMIIATLVLSFIIGSASSYVSAESVSENDTTVISVSENSDITTESILINTEDNLNPYGHHKDFVQSQRDTLIKEGYQFIDLDLPNNGTWGYDQTFARTELFSEFNKARMDTKNWWYVSDNDGSKTTVSISNNYVYDTELEKAAMQRAAELLFAYIHARPDRVNYSEVYDTVNSPYQWSRGYNEMISFAPMDTFGANDQRVLIEPTAEGIVYGFMESYENMPGAQLHRKCILTDKYYRIGIGVVKLADGHRFVAVEVSEDKTADGEYIPVYSDTDPVDGYKETTVQIAYKPNDTNRCLHSVINVLSPIKENELGGYIKLIPGEAFNLSQEWFSRNQKSSSAFGLCTGTDSLFFNPSNGQWKSDNTDIADVTDNRIIAKNPGTTDINFTDITDGHVVGSVKVTVPEPVLQSAAATYDNGNTLIGTTIYGDDVTLTNHFDYGEDEDVTLSDYGVYSFTVSKEGTNTFTFNHPDAPAGTTIPVTLTVQGIKETPAPKPPKKEESTVKPAAPSTNIEIAGNAGNTRTLYSQKITVAEKFRKTFTISRRKLKKFSRVYKINAKVTPLDGGVGHGLVSYKVTKYPKGARKYITVNKKGKITIKRNAKKGTYKIKITANSVSNRLKKASKTITIKVK